MSAATVLLADEAPVERQHLYRVVEQPPHETGPVHDDRSRSLHRTHGTMIGRSSNMRTVLDLVSRAAPTRSTILIRGESGTGKELIARAIHEQSARRNGPFIKVHCAAIPDTLLESELFGYEKGAFTGAVTRKPGRVELAEGGTLFLDEIGDITPAMQVKLLRVLQEREYERLGGKETLRADIRFVAATHRDLEAMMLSGQFREDLFYRLTVVPIWAPALRERPDDIIELAAHFCARIAEESGIRACLDDEALDVLSRQAWPGNVRQLQNFIERLVVLSDGPTLRAADVMRELKRQPSAQPAVAIGLDAQTLPARREAAEKDALVFALQRAGNNRTEAARLLGVSRRTLYKKLSAFGMS